MKYVLKKLLNATWILYNPLKNKIERDVKKIKEMLENDSKK